MMPRFFPAFNSHQKRKHSEIKTPSPTADGSSRSLNLLVNKQQTPDTIHNNTLSPLSAPLKKFRSFFKMPGNRANKDAAPSTPLNYRQNPDSFSDSPSSQRSSGRSDNCSLASSSTLDSNTSQRSRSRSRPRRFHEPEEKMNRPTRSRSRRVPRTPMESSHAASFLIPAT